MKPTLKEFVYETIMAILAGVSEAQQKSGWQKVNPPISKHEVLEVSKQHGFMTGVDGELVQKIEFDVAVEASRKKGTQAGLGVFVAAASAGLLERTSQKNSSFSRVKFCVPLSLPTGNEGDGPHDGA